MREKLKEYFSAGVTLVWIIDPKRKTARVYREGKLAKTLTDKDQLTGEDVLPGFRLSLKTLLGKIEGKPRR